jgi:hypothetical protein
VLRAMALEIHGGQAENAEKREERKIFWVLVPPNLNWDSQKILVEFRSCLEFVHIKTNSSRNNSRWALELSMAQLLYLVNWATIVIYFLLNIICAHPFFAFFVTALSIVPTLGTWNHRCTSDINNHYILLGNNTFTATGSTFRARIILTLHIYPGHYKQASSLSNTHIKTRTLILYL